MTRGYSIKYFKLPIYGANIVITHHSKSNFYEVLDKVCDKYGLNPEMSNDLHLCHGLSYDYYSEDKGQYFYIFVNTDYHKEYFDTIIHELYHMTQAIIKHYGISEVKGEPNEAVAYMFGYLANLIVNKKLIK